MTERDIDGTLLDAIEDSGALCFAADLGDHVLKSFLDDSPLKDIPVLGAILKIIQGGNRLGSLLLARKIAGFMKPLTDIPEEKRAVFGSRMQKDVGFRKKVGEHLLILIDRLDDYGKPELLAHAFQAFMNEEIDFNRFRELGAAIDRCLLDDLNHLSVSPNQNNWPPAVATRLSGCGLLELDSVQTIRAEGQTWNIYLLTEFGQCMIDVVLNEPK